MLTLALSMALATASALAAPAQPAQLDGRALGDTSYRPYNVTCPTGWTWVRNATTGLATGEQAFITARERVTNPVINSQMAAHGLSNPPRTPTIGVALAGGGYRAMLTGLGGIMSMMNGSSEAAASGLGGWLDGVTYWAGLSGGSWATGSFMANGGPLPIDLITSLWNLDSNLIFPDDDKVSFYTELITETHAKGDEGFPTQLTDLWGLAVGSHVLPTQYQLGNNPNLTFSSLPSVVGKLGNASLPMPIIISAEREPGELVIAENATVWEYTPYEFGAWAFGSTEKSPGAFTPIEYLGSELNNGSPNGTCYKGFDQLSFVMGSSATLFNGALLEINSSDSSLINTFVTDFLRDLGEDQYDVARVPNSFAGYNSGQNPTADLEYITLVDGGETNQNIPIEPLLIPFRNVDAIVAFDSSFDTTYTWPNGTSLRTTFERARILAERTDTMVRMPEVPSENGFINGGYNTRPTFFGCNDTTTPLIIYVPSYPWSYAANTSTSCFDTWCWAGDDNTTTPNTYEPVINSVPPWLIARNLTTGAANAPGVNTTASTSSSGADRRIEGALTVVGMVVAGVLGLGMVL
ncbi:hypothetical protein IAR55_004591 [Kwoniella newhampshirensis]|uniref:Lysophospholipase n=1 Tax=Kwoniella newhampshirensis TaxID=1651941 RepID=A0AAW0YKL8_9TREE